MAVKKRSKAPEYITKAGLKGKRGWTELLIKKFLPRPDKTGKSPWYGNDIYFYLLTRVSSIEGTKEFHQMKSISDYRRKIAYKGNATKRNKIISFIHRLAINVPVYSKDVLIKKACDAYNRRNANKQYEEDSYWTLADERSDWHFLNRICINYLRHECTSYEKQLKAIAGKVGNEDAYRLLKEKVNDAILRAYDFLEKIQESEFA